MTPRVELHDCRHPQRVTFGWWGFGLARTTPLVEVRLDFGDAMHVTAIVEGPGIASRLIPFLEEIGAQAGDWDGWREFRSADENLQIVCTGCDRGRLLLEVTLDADSQDPAWTVCLRLEVEHREWPGVVGQFRDYFAAVNGIGPQSEPSAPADGGGGSAFPDAGVQ